MDLLSDKGKAGCSLQAHLQLVQVLEFANEVVLQQNDLEARGQYAQGLDLFDVLLM